MTTPSSDTSQEPTMTDISIEPTIATPLLAESYPVSLRAAVIAPNPDDPEIIEVVYRAEVGDFSAVAASPEDAILLAADKLYEAVNQRTLDLIRGASSDGSRWVERGPQERPAHD